MHVGYTCDDLSSFHSGYFKKKQPGFSNSQYAKSLKRSAQITF